MGCHQCGVAPHAGISYPYRWGNATIEIVACREHALEIIEALNKAQAQKASPKGPTNGV